MQLPKGATVAVVDGENLSLFRNAGDEANPELKAVPAADVSNDNKGSGGRHQSSAANPDSSQLEEDSFAAGAVGYLNDQVVKGKISKLLVIAAPKTLGEMRKNYHQKLTAALVGEINKELAGRPIDEIAKAIAAA